MIHLVDSLQRAFSLIQKDMSWRDGQGRSSLCSGMHRGALESLMPIIIDARMEIGCSTIAAVTSSLARRICSDDAFWCR